MPTGELVVRYKVPEAGTWDIRLRKASPEPGEKPCLLVNGKGKVIGGFDNKLEADKEIRKIALRRIKARQDDLRSRSALIEKALLLNQEDPGTFLDHYGDRKMNKLPKHIREHEANVEATEQ